MPTRPTISINSAQSPAQEPDAAARHILVIDEMAAKLEELTASLSGAGYAVDLATTAGDALEQIRENTVELVLLGESLPGMSGLDLLRLLRAAWTPQQLPVIMLAPDARNDVETAALSAGANDCMAPSVDGGRALARVQSQLRQKDAGQGAIERAERVYRATAGATDVIWEWNLATETFWFSSEWGRLIGRPSGGPTRLEEWLASIHPDDAPAVEAALHKLHDDPEQLEFGHEYRLMGPAGEPRWIYCRANVERDRDGKLLRLTGLQTDITRNKSIDWLTQLPNRENILDRVDRMLAADKDPFALLLLDLDRFRVVNESLGASAGDRILREIALRLERATRTVSTGGRPEDYLARVHGDTFLLILSNVDTVEMARVIADRLQSQVRRPLQVAGREIRLSASIGIALSRGENYTRAFDLLRDAEIALHQAKALGRARAIGFDADMRRETIHRMDLEIDLRRALENKEFLLVYQPKLDLETHTLAGFEALIRWRHPQLGLVSPITFIPVAEETGMIIPIGAWALEESARQFAEWRSRLPGLPFQVSVNLSVKQFFDREIVDRVESLMRQFQLPPGEFCLEVTESVLIGDMQLAANILERLHRKGAGLMIDDFGTGYSSLNYLTNLPFDALKIDRSFISRVEEDENCAEVVKAIVTLAGNLKLQVIAEGVETPEQADYLRKIGCRYAQGYHFAKPLDAATATALVERRRLTPEYKKPEAG